MVIEKINKFFDMIFPREQISSDNLFYIIIILFISVIFILMHIYWDGVANKRESLYAIFFIFSILLLLLNARPFNLILIMIISIVIFRVSGIYYLGPIQYFKGIGVSTIDPLWLIFFISYIFYNLYKKRDFKVIRYEFPIFLFLLFFFISMLVSFVKGNYWFNIIWESRLYLYGIFLYIIIIHLLNNIEEVNLLINIILLITVLSVLFALYQFRYIETIWAYEAGGMFSRVPSFFGHPNMYAGFLELIFPIVLTFMLFSNRITEKIYYFSILSLIFIGVLLTLSRGGFVALLISSGIVGIKFNAKKTIIVALIFITLFLILSFTITQGIFARQLSVFQLFSDEKKGSTSLPLAIRLVEYSNMLKTWSKNFLFGAGWGSKEIEGFFNIATYRISYYPMKRFNRYIGNDNLYLDIAHKGGLFVILSFIIVLISGMIKIYKNTKINNLEIRKISIGLFAGLFSFLCHQGFDNFLKKEVTSFFFWFLFASGIFLYYKYYKKENGNTSNQQ